jgi:hypothetical protein
MYGFNVRQARIAIAAANTKTTKFQKNSIYKYFGFANTIDIKKINYYIPIIDQIEKQCKIKITTIECSHDPLFDRWVDFLNDEEKIEFS